MPVDANRLALVRGGGTTPTACHPTRPCLTSIDRKTMASSGRPNRSTTRMIKASYERGWATLILRYTRNSAIIDLDNGLMQPGRQGSGDPQIDQCHSTGAFIRRRH